MGTIPLVPPTAQPGRRVEARRRLMLRDGAEDLSSPRPGKPTTWRRVQRAQHERGTWRSLVNTGAPWPSLDEAEVRECDGDEAAPMGDG